MKRKRLVKRPDTTPESLHQEGSLLIKLNCVLLYESFEQSHSTVVREVRGIHLPRKQGKKEKFRDAILNCSPLITALSQGPFLESLSID